MVFDTYRARLKNYARKLFKKSGGNESQRRDIHSEENRTWKKFRQIGRGTEDKKTLLCGRFYHNSIWYILPERNVLTKARKNLENQILKYLKILVMSKFPYRII